MTGSASTGARREGPFDENPDLDYTLFMDKLPVFATEKAAAEWFASHDTAPYMDDLEDVTEEFRALRGEKTSNATETSLPRWKHTASRC